MADKDFPTNCNDNVMNRVTTDETALGQTMNPPWLTQEEIEDLCRPLTQPAAQIRYLRRQGLTVRTKPNGAPLVLRAHFESVMNPAGKPQTSGKREPDRSGLIASFTRA